MPPTDEVDDKHVVEVSQSTAFTNLPTMSEPELKKLIDTRPAWAIFHRYQNPNGSISRLFCKLSLHALMDDETACKEFPILTAIVTIIVKHRVPSTAVCLGLTYDLRGHGDQRVYVPLEDAQRGIWPTKAEHERRIAGGIKNQLECSFTLSGASNLIFFNVGNSPADMFKIKADVPSPEDCLTHEKQAGHAIVSPATKHSVSCKLIKDDSIVMRTQEDDPVMVHAAQGAGPHGVGLNLLCSLPSQEAADACMAELVELGLPSGPVLLPHFAAGGAFYEAIPTNFERHPQHAGGNGFGNSTREEHAIACGKNDPLHAIKSGKNDPLHAIKSGKGDPLHAKKSVNEGVDSTRAALIAAGWSIYCTQGSRTQVCHDPITGIKYRSLKTAYEALQQSEGQKAAKRPRVSPWELM